MNLPKFSVVSMAPPALSRKEKRGMKHLPGNSKRDQLRKWFTVLYRYYKETNDLGVYWRLEKIIPFTRVKNPETEGIAEIYQETAEWVEKFQNDIRMYEKEKGSDKETLARMKEKSSIT
jgi:transposase-like protein